jgi:hypothetical protein
MQPLTGPRPLQALPLHPRYRQLITEQHRHHNPWLHTRTTVPQSRLTNPTIRSIVSPTNTQINMHMVKTQLPITSTLISMLIATIWGIRKRRTVKAKPGAAMVPPTPPLISLHNKNAVPLTPFIAAMTGDEELPDEYLTNTESIPKLSRQALSKGARTRAHQPGEIADWSS